MRRSHLSLVLLAAFFGAGLPSRTAAAQTSPSTANEWTLMGGGPNAVGANCGTLGVPSTANIPSFRYEASSWTDSQGNFWLFGGMGGDCIGGYGALNDLWELNPSTNEWVWVDGSASVGVYDAQPGIYGTLGVPAIGNIPASRAQATSWSDTNGNLWVFGGQGYNGAFDDLWKFNIPTGLWTWMSGAAENVPPGTPVNIHGNWCQVSSVLHPGPCTPGWRLNASGWTDHSGNLWLFGGLGGDINGFGDYLNDLWEFNTLTNTWKWVGGNGAGGSFGGIAVNGTLGFPAPGNIPGARIGSSSWTDADGHFWLFGGHAYDPNGHVGFANDLWELDPTSGEWTWVSGGGTFQISSFGQTGVYGTLGTPAPGNVPGGREYASSWVDKAGNFWIFGGVGIDSTGSSYGHLNDLWKFSPITKNWTWMGGSNTVQSGGGFSDAGVYGALGVASPGNIPGGRDTSTSGWTDTQGNLWLFGGYGTGNSIQDLGAENDLWMYQPPSSQSVAATPSFSLSSGTYLGSQIVTISDATAGATIYYTTNGTMPTTGSTVYNNAPIPIAASQTIQAMAVATGYSQSAVASSTYTILPALQINWPTPLPIPYGTALSSIQLNATANIAGTFHYSIATGTILGAGNRTLSVLFTPTDTTDYTSATATVLLQVNPATLTVTANNQTSTVGATLPTLTASYNGFTNGDTSAVLSGSPTLSTTATSASPVGLYTISVAKGTLSAANYTFNLVNGTLALSAALPPTLTTSTMLSLVSGGYTASVTINNSGKGAASNVQLTTATLGSASSTNALPLNLGTIAAGGSTTVSISFPSSSGSPGTASTDKFAGTYAGGSFSSSGRVTLP